MVYPGKISERLLHLRGKSTPPEPADAAAVAANFECGSFVRFFINSGSEGMVGDLTYQTNGCGYMAAAADVLTESIGKSELKALHGLEPAELRSQVTGILGAFPDNRRECLETVIEAVRSAFADLRNRHVGEFEGETALICTCFGVTQDRIEDLVRTRHVRSVSEITDATNAGRGCGSCRMLILEIIDMQELD